MQTQFCHLLYFAVHRARLMTTSIRSPAMQYFVAIVIVGAAAVMTRLFWGFTAAAPAAFFLVAVGVSAWIGGMGPGLMATGASFAAIAGLLLLLVGDLRYLDGVEVDYVESLEGAGFKFNNPNVKSTCGCGSSFSVD